MAEIVTSVVDFGRQRGWDLPSSLRPGPIARQEIVFAGTTPIPSKILTDTSRYSLSCRLTSNFVYRLIQIDMVGMFPTLNEATAWESGMQVSILGVTNTRDFPLYNAQRRSGDVGESFRFSVSETLQFTTIFLPHPDMSLPVLIETIVDPSSISEILIEWIDATGTATPAISVIHQVRILQYTVEQSLRFPINSPFPVIQL